MNTVKEDRDAIATKNSVRPPFPYAQMIAQAIESTIDKKMTLNDIYNYVIENFPYFKSAGSGWKVILFDQNSVRHNLSLNKSFIRVPRPATEKGKGSYWTICDGNVSKKKRQSHPYEKRYKLPNYPTLREPEDSLYYGYFDMASLQLQHQSYETNALTSEVLSGQSSSLTDSSQDYLQHWIDQKSLSFIESDTSDSMQAFFLQDQNDGYPLTQW